jgi:hypothetical protein
MAISAIFPRGTTVTSLKKSFSNEEYMSQSIETVSISELLGGRGADVRDPLPEDVDCPP